MKKCKNVAQHQTFSSYSQIHTQNTQASLKSDVLTRHNPEAIKEQMNPWPIN
jgi:hypothetical protein